MVNHKYTPKGILEPYVKCMWHCHDYRPLSKKERVLPNDVSQLIINLGNKRFRHFEGDDCSKEKKCNSPIIAGIHTSNIFLDSFSRLSTMHVVLRPGALNALFDIPADEFKNQITALEIVVGSCISTLSDKLLETTNSNEKFNLVKQFLVNRLDRCFQANPAVIYSAEQIREKNGCLSIGEIRDEVGYSHRRFSELFKRIVGVSPKQYARICRFQYALGSIHEMEVPDWLSIALDSGYYDQSHFIHEFKSFSGISPTEYHHNRSDEINHLPA